MNCDTCKRIQIADELVLERECQKKSYSHGFVDYWSSDCCSVSASGSFSSEFFEVLLGMSSFFLLEVAVSKTEQMQNILIIIRRAIQNVSIAQHRETRQRVSLRINIARKQPVGRRRSREKYLGAMPSQPGHREAIAKDKRIEALKVTSGWGMGTGISSPADQQVWGVS